jgi:3-oxoadipate enol-lactonase
MIAQASKTDDKFRVPAPSDLPYFIERGSGPPLLLLHGVLVTGAMFDPVLDRFATRHRVIVPDLRGHGRSRGLGPPYTAAQTAADLAHLLDHLGIVSTAVLGYSQGGAFAQQLVLDFPARCDHLVLACTFAFNKVTFRERLEGMAASLLLRVLGIERFAKIVASQAAKEFGKEPANWLEGMIASQDRAPMLAALRELATFDSRRRLLEIRCPTLVVAGSNDQAVPLLHARMLHDGIAGSRLLVVDDANHVLIWTHPEELVRATDEFLGQPLR